MVCNHHVWDSFLRYQLENGLHKIPAPSPRLECDCVDLYLRFLLRVDLQSLQRLLLGDLSSLMRPSEHRLCFTCWSPYRKDPIK